MRVLVESSGHDRVERTVAGPDDVGWLLDEWAGREETTLSFGLDAETEEAEVIVAVTAAGWLLTRHHEGDFQQLVGDPEASGEIVPTLGGQPTPTPMRWLLRRADVERALTAYLRDSAFPDDLSWEV
ncbi:Imm1 family immunity protein [Jidongwangia harbinensis]|uniref:Imm1 family immunity protein n=1 Tax=Jidongwangia harbinensis TaxID=2878561 RepID=UPI001CD9F17F|nr:Imm1 family immunity protein [Jidongwangia harbinensis]MCA2217949.1 hypothetical protein [Jidongwangia harbinensis]